MSLKILLVDAANVVGAGADGWQNDRAGAARRLHEQLVVADTTYDYDEIVLVLEGQAKAGVRPGRDGNVRTVHAPHDGDSTIISTARNRRRGDGAVTVVTADRLLRRACELAGAQVMSPAWLLSQLD